MARNTPISVVRSLTEPIMVMNTTRTSMPTTTPTIARLKPLNSFTACMRLCTASRTVVTSASGSAGESWRTIWSTEAPEYAAATSMSVSSPGRPSSSWTAPRSAMSRSSSWAPVGRRIPVSVKRLPRMRT